MTSLLFLQKRRARCVCWPFTHADLHLAPPHGLGYRSRVMSIANPTETNTASIAPVLVCALAIFLLCVMDAVMRQLTFAIGVYSTVLARSILACLTMGAVWLNGPRIRPNASLSRLHALRAFTVGGVLILFFWGLARMPLAEAIALSFVAPLVALFMAAFVLGERIQRAAIFGSVAGLGGVGVIMAGQFGHQNYGPDTMWGALAVLGSAVFYAYNLILARRQALLAGPVEIGFFQNLCLVAMLSLAAPWLAVMPSVEHWPHIVAATALSLTGLVLMTWSYARAEAQRLIPMEYTAFVWAALLGWFVFDEPVSWTTIFGAGMIIAGCLIAAGAKPSLSKPIEPAGV